MSRLHIKKKFSKCYIKSATWGHLIQVNIYTHKMLELCEQSINNIIFPGLFMKKLEIVVRGNIHRALNNVPGTVLNASHAVTHIIQLFKFNAITTALVSEGG